MDRSMCAELPAATAASFLLTLTEVKTSGEIKFEFKFWWTFGGSSCDAAAIVPEWSRMMRTRARWTGRISSSASAETLRRADGLWCERRFLEMFRGFGELKRPSKFAASTHLAVFLSILFG